MSPNETSNSDELSKAADALLEMDGSKMATVLRVARIVYALNRAHMRDFALPTNDSEYLGEVDELLTLLHINQEEDDSPELRLENLCCLIAAGFRYAEHLTAKLDTERLIALIQDVESEVAK